MKFKGIIFLAVVYFLAVNSSYLWSRNLGSLLFYLAIVGDFVFFGLVIIFLIFLNSAVKENFANKQRVTAMVIVLIIIILTCFRPTGIIDFDKLIGENLLIAQREGVANCTTTLKLKENNKFTETIICFGLYEYKGKYEIINDTIFFQNVSIPKEQTEYFEFATIQLAVSKTNDEIYNLIRFQSKNDSIGQWLRILKNDL
jgi:hypothetical protein